MAVHEGLVLAGKLLNAVFVVRPRTSRNFFRRHLQLSKQLLR